MDATRLIFEETCPHCDAAFHSLTKGLHGHGYTFEYECGTKEYVSINGDYPGSVTQHMRCMRAELETRRKEDKCPPKTNSDE